MGFRGHVRKVNNIEYGSGEGNGAYHLVAEIVNYFGAGICGYEDNGNTWEIDRTELEEAIHAMNEPLTVEQKRDIVSIAEEQGWKGEFDGAESILGYVLEAVNAWLNQAAAGDWIVVDWF